MAWQAILNVIDLDGLLAGCSASAMIQGELFAGFQRGDLHEGFELWLAVHEVPAAIIASMRSMMGKQITIVGMERNTAFVHRDGQ